MKQLHEVVLHEAVTIISAGYPRLTEWKPDVKTAWGFTDRKVDGIEDPYKVLECEKRDDFFIFQSHSILRFIPDGCLLYYRGAFIKSVVRACLIKAADLGFAFIHPNVDLSLDAIEQMYDTIGGQSILSEEAKARIIERLDLAALEQLERLKSSHDDIIERVRSAPPAGVIFHMKDTGDKDEENEDSKLKGLKIQEFNYPDDQSTKDKEHYDFSVSIEYFVPDPSDGE